MVSMRSFWSGSSISSLAPQIDLDHRGSFCTWSMLPSASTLPSCSTVTRRRWSARSPCRARPPPPSARRPAVSSSAVRSISCVGHAGHRLVDQQQRGSCISSMPISSHCFWPWRQAPAASRARSPGRWSPAPRRCGRARSPVSARNRSRHAACRPAMASSRFSNTCGSRTRSASGTCGRCRGWRSPARLSRSRSMLRRTTPAGVGPGLAGDDVHHGGLAGAVGADDAAQLAGVDVEVQAVERLEAVEADRDAVQVEDRPVAASVHRRVRRAGSTAARSRGMVAGSSRAHAAGVRPGSRARLPAIAPGPRCPRQEQVTSDEQRAQGEQPELGKAR
jgi:hypothetical protein